jgi:[ribosomal protein S5]-alanine N-acetyltransferase
MKTQKPMRTPRLRLEPPHEAHLPALVEIHKRNETQFFGKMPRIIRRVVDARRWLVVSARAQRYVIVLAATHEPIGMISLSNIDGAPLESATLGYWIDHAHTGHGYVREAATRMLKHAFGPLKLHRVEANIEPSNRRSIRVINALGFRFEGTRKQYLFLGEKWRDQRSYALLKDEWKV